jgi:hypothetical protein
MGDLAEAELLARDPVGQGGLMLDGAEFAYLVFGEAVLLEGIPGEERLEGFGRFEAAEDEAHPEGDAGAGKEEEALVVAGLEVIAVALDGGADGFLGGRVGDLDEKVFHGKPFIMQEAQDVPSTLLADFKLTMTPTKAEMTKAILAAKAAKKLLWADLARATGLSEVFTTSACLGENALGEEEAARLVALLDLAPGVAAALCAYGPGTVQVIVTADADGAVSKALGEEGSEALSPSPTTSAGR